jgi:Carboxypeptidase regulatory-like domain
MKRRVSSASTLARPAGLWLRCFLGGALCLASAGSLTAQVDIPKPERLTHVEGFVADPKGHPVPDIEVSLVRPDFVTIVLKTRTDQSGAFHFDHVKGDYLFRVARSTYAPAERAIFVTDEIVTALERKKLYVILGPGACQDACSAVLTNKKDFDRAIHKNSQHH